MMILAAMLVGKREGIDRTLNHVRKCDRHDQTLSANPVVHNCLMQRWMDIEGYLQDHFQP
jgi:hypothetical protein